MSNDQRRRRGCVPHPPGPFPPTAAQRQAESLIGGNIVAAVIILIRGFGLLQPLELQIYDALVVAWAGHKPSNRIVLVGGTEADVEHFDWPLRDGDLATLLERLESWHPRAIGVGLIAAGNPADDIADRSGAPVEVKVALSGTGVLERLNWPKLWNRLLPNCLPRLAPIV